MKHIVAQRHLPQVLLNIVGKVLTAEQYRHFRLSFKYCGTITSKLIMVFSIKVLYTQTCDTWINVHDLLYFLDIDDSKVTFLWASEETGFRHIYLITSSLSAKAINGCIEASAKTSTSAFDSSQRLKYHFTPNMSDNHGDAVDAATLHPRILNKVRNLELQVCV